MEMEARALKKYIRSSPRKMRLVIDQIRGKKINEALSILKFSPKMASDDAFRLLQSAIGNLEYKARENEEFVSRDEMFVKECFVNQGPTAKRINPAPMGRGFRIRKRSNHLTIVVASKNKQEVSQSSNEENI